MPRALVCPSGPAQLRLTPARVSRAASARCSAARGPPDPFFLGSRARQPTPCGGFGQKQASWWQQHRRLAHGSSGRPPGAWGGGSGGGGKQPVTELLEDIPGKGEVLSAELDPELRQRAEQAISRRGYRVTIGDVAASAGLNLNQAEEAVRALAADALATLQVSESGEILYVFKRSFQQDIRNRSLKLRLEPLAASVRDGGAYLARVAFGTALITSVVTVYAALMVISSSRDDRGERRGGGYGGYNSGARMMFDLTDILWYWDPFYFQRRRAMLAAAGQVQQQQNGQQQGMNFLEAIFSWVFGDGDPNGDYDKARWQAIGKYIQYKGGVVAAEELAPFLDVRPGQVASDRGRMVVDEGYMVPVLARFQGHPQVDSEGNILYEFPALQQTSKAAKAAPPRAAALEERWQLTSAGPGQKLAAIALGALNLVGVLALSSALGSPANQYALARNGLAWVMGAMPFLQAYATTFFAIPLVRWALNAQRNAGIDSRNQGREESLRLLRAPDPVLLRKLESASQQARQVEFGQQRTVYRSDKDTSSQPEDREAALFEERLNRRTREREQQERGWQPAPPPQQKRQKQAEPQRDWWR